MLLMDKWEVLKSYRQLAHRPLLVCAECHEEYSVGFGPNDEPEFWDFYCDKTVRFGLEHWEALARAVEA